MGKKKSRPKKPKPLLSLQGILHLQNSFVQPSQESGLLSTVGGLSEQALVLAPNYGYGIPASSLETNDENQDEPQPGNVDSESKTEEETTTTTTDSCLSNSSAKENEANPDDLSVAELVRQIGGAKGKPILRRDVVEDREDVLKEQEQAESAVVEEIAEEEDKNHVETDEFYASIGMAPPEKNTKKGSSSPEHQNSPQPVPDTNTTDPGRMVDEPHIEPEPIDERESVADYYKSLNNYYYSSVPDPFSDDRIEFGSSITPAEPDATPAGEILRLAKMAQKRKRAMEAAISTASKAQAKIAKLSTDGEKENDGRPDEYDPLPMEIIPSESTAALNITADTNLEQYWEYVKENPHDFNRWTYLVHYAENSRNLNECRQVYSSFLPLFPYCFGYWKRYCELEKGHHYFQRALTILQRGLDFNPLCIDLWLSYLNFFCEVYIHTDDYETIVRQQYEKALCSAGMDFRSDALWDAFIDWEQNQKRLKQVFTLYLRLIQVPTRLYNRHWDNVQALIRDHHPRDILDKDYYEKLRKKGCRILKFRYKPEPEIEPGEIRKTTKPEDELMDHVKTKLLERLGAIHSNTVSAIDKRWDFEDLIRRPYFHVKPLDKRQLNNWEAYLNFEIREGNHDRIILLFERCLTACAQYESFWCRYGRYVENYHKKNKTSESDISIHLQKSQINVEIVSKKQTDEEEALIADIESILNNILTELERQEALEMKEVQLTLENIMTELCKFDDMTATNNEIFNSNLVVSKVVNSDNDCQGYLSGHSAKASESPPKCAEQNEKFNSATSSGLTSLISLPTFPPAKFYWQEIVRDIYKRACVIHCARKPACRLQWAAFEEEIGNEPHLQLFYDVLGNVDEARKLILHVLEWFPTHLEAKMQLIELERRSQNLEAVESAFEEYLRKSKSKEEFSTLALKYARFLAKEVLKPDKALLILKKAAKKDKGNPRIYSHIYELCYERFPADRKGAHAALQIAINCKELTNEQRLIFAKKMVHFLQEHGDLRKYRDAMDQMYEFQSIVHEERMQDYKLKAYNVPGRSMDLEAFPAPDWSSVLEKCNTLNSEGVPIQFESLDADGNPKEETRVANENPDQENAYKEVAPTRELLVGSEYGYGSKHPDVKLTEQLCHKEYEKLESKGYAEHLLDINVDPDTVSRKRKLDPKVPLYIVAPKGSYLMSYLGGPNTAENPPVPGGDLKRIKLDAPIELSMLPMPTASPCVNVPDWFVKEGGELCLSETPNGFSIIRYWPHFMSETGNKKMFRSIRKCVKWHQKQHLVVGRWRHLTRLVSWLGPCEFSNNGFVMPRNENWPPEVLDLLHRIIQMTRHEFNSCALNLYRTGHDNIGWHSDSMPALGANPAIASVSLGALRTFELRRRGRVHNFIRFPLFPGSLLLMEGATQEDWSHQIPKEPLVKEERINLTFRVMHAVDDIEKTPGYKVVQAKPSSTNSTETSEVKSTSTETTTSTTVTTTTSTVSAAGSTDTGSKNTPPKDLTTSAGNKPDTVPKIIFHKK